MNIKISVIILILLSLSLYGEPSVYGLSGSVKDKKEMHNMKKKIASLTQNIAEQSLKIEGFQTMIEGLIASINSLKYDGKHSLKKITVLERKIKKLEKKSLDKKYIIHKVTNNKKEVKKIPFMDTLTPSELYKEGVSLFVKKSYNEAKKRFLLTDKKGYKLASSNYYLGELSYYSKSYNNAIFYYQKSSGFKEDASYMGTLLLHTAISLEKIGQKENARKFYNNIIEVYKDTNLANISKQRLKNL